MVLEVDLDDTLVWLLQERASAVGLPFDVVLNDALAYVTGTPSRELTVPKRVGVYVRAGYDDGEIADLLSFTRRRVAEMRRDLGLRANPKRRKKGLTPIR